MTHTWATDGLQTIDDYDVMGTGHTPVARRYSVTWHCGHCNTDLSTPVSVDADGIGTFLIDPPKGAEMPYGRWRTSGGDEL